MQTIKTRITEEIIEEGRKNIYQTTKCIGALLLKSFFPNDNVTWGTKSGTVREGLYFKLTDGLGNVLNAVDIREPMDVELVEIDFMDKLFIY